MSSSNSLLIHFYWGGKIVHAGGSMLYDPPMPKKILFLTERLSLVELEERVYNFMGLDRHRYKIILIFRSCLSNGVFGAMPLMDDNGVNGMYFIKGNSGHATEIYVEVEELPQLDLEDTQHFRHPSPQNYQGIGPPSPQHMNWAGTSGLYDSQITQLEEGNIETTRNMQRRRSVEYGPSSSRPFILNMEDPLPHNIDADIECVDVDSEPEPEGDDSDDEGHDNEDIGPTTNLVVGTSSYWTPKFRDEAGVDAILDFDPLDVVADKLKLWNEHTNELEVGQLFDSKDHVQRAVKLWSIKENREFKVRESSPKTWYVRCSARDSTPRCNWQLRATLRKSEKMWKIVKLKPDHTCVRVCNSNDHRQLSGDIIAFGGVP